MATEYVVLDTSQLNNSSRVVVHSDTPGGNNAVGTPWTTALIEYKGTPVASVVPASVMPVGRQTALDAGTKYEWVFTAEYNANLTPTQKQTEIEAQISARQAQEQTRLQNLLRFWGHTGSVT